ncbi:hypothetical protein FB45DRAFT_934285 [Roridomyces roridus]|uniref:Uncharacterized protein n=1 Tax=Roridomyces roridus TaxID=1738132 RepID=A0AAD7BBT9_9AGAR|nr:hypothetical protein FB45DRAFT_934285 [Roridomyces roridus]
MLASVVTLLFLAASAQAHYAHGQSQTRSAHSSLAMAIRSNDTLHAVEKRASFTNAPITWYPTDTGPDACTGKTHGSNDWVVAMNPIQFGSGCCGKQLQIDYNGKTAVVTCVDECSAGACTAFGGLDLTEGLFTYFTGDAGLGSFSASWSFVSGAGGGGDDTTTTSKTSTSTTTTKHTTSTTATHTSTTATSTSSTSSSVKASTTTTVPTSASASASNSASATSGSAAPTGSSSVPIDTDAGNVALFSDTMMQLLGLVVQAQS